MWLFLLGATNKYQNPTHPNSQSWAAGPYFLLSPFHQQGKARKASGQWGVEDRQKLGVVTFLVISSIWGQNGLGIPSF